MARDRHRRHRNRVRRQIRDGPGRDDRTPDDPGRRARRRLASRARRAGAGDRRVHRAAPRPVEHRRQHVGAHVVGSDAHRRRRRARDARHRGGHAVGCRRVGVSHRERQSTARRLGPLGDIRTSRGRRGQAPNARPTAAQAGRRNSGSSVRAPSASTRRPRRDGTAGFGIDTRQPGMLVAVVKRCPVFGGKVARFDAAKAKAVPGVRQVVEISSGVAVVADGYWPAYKGRDALTVEWDLGPNATLDSAGIWKRFEDRIAQPLALVRDTGNVATADPDKTVDAEYRVAVLGARDNGADELLRARAGRRVQCVGAHAESNRRARYRGEDHRSLAGPGRYSHDVFRRRLWPPLRHRFRERRRRGIEGRRRAGEGDLRSARRHAAQWLSARRAAPVERQVRRQRLARCVDAQVRGAVDSRALRRASGGQGSQWRRHLRHRRRFSVHDSQHARGVRHSRVARARVVVAFRWAFEHRLRGRELLGRARRRRRQGSRGAQAPLARRLAAPARGAQPGRGEIRLGHAAA